MDDGAFKAAYKKKGNKTLISYLDIFFTIIRVTGNEN